MLRRFDLQDCASSPLFALAVRRVDGEPSHCAIAYKEESGELLLLHLAFNYRMGRSPPTSEYMWVESGIPEQTIKLLAVISARIRAQKPLIPYGLDAQGWSFDPETGAVISGPPGKGFTCATFILAVLKTQGLNLLAEEEWPENANEAWQNHVVKQLELDPLAPAEQVSNVRSDIGCRRFSPEEVVASSSEAAENWPIGFPTAAALARLIGSI